MPRKTNKKQTRLAWAPTTTSGDANDSKGDRFARLRYGHPSVGTVRPEMPSQTKPASPPTEASPSTATTSRREDSPVKESKHTKKEKTEKKKDKTDNMAKAEKKEKKKSRQKEPEVQVQIVQAKEESSSEDEIVAPGSLQRARRTANPDFAIMKPSKPTKSPQLPSGSPGYAISIDSSDEDQANHVQPRRRLKRKAERSSAILSDSDDSEPVVSSPVKRRRRASPTETPQTPHAGVDRNRQELEDDVKDLEDSVVKKTRTRGRTYESARDKKLKLLETLRRRRAGEKEESEEEPEEESDAEVPRSSPTQHFFNQRRHNDEDSDVESEIGANEDLDRYEDDFVLEDNELGVPTEEIPFEFTRHAYKQPKEYFRDVVAWMVHNRIDPAFPRDDTMYQVAFQKLNDEVKARAGSSLISSVWSAKFRQVLLARPHLDISSFPTSFMHSCDACNRSNHPASADLKFYGKPYSEETLEPLSDDSSENDYSDVFDSSDETSEDDDSPDESDVERSRDGNVLPDESTRFYLGKTCKANAYMAHLLTHWRYQLNEWVVDYLRRKGHMEDAEVLRRENMSQKRKTRNAIEVCKRMEAEGEIERLYKDFHLHLKTAREKTSTMELLG